MLAVAAEELVVEVVGVGALHAVFFQNGHAAVDEAADGTDAREVVADGERDAALSAQVVRREAGADRGAHGVGHDEKGS